MKSFKIAIFLISIAFLFFWFFRVSKETMAEYYYAMILTSPYRREVISIRDGVGPKPEINAESFISVKISKDGREKIILEKDIDRGLPIASLTKLMTAIVTLENCQQEKLCDFSDIVKISEKASSQGDVCFQANLLTNQEKSVKNLLDLALIYSSNDSAYALAEIIGEQNFVQKMNQKAESLNLKNTYFVNPTGLDPEKEIPNYSTARELYKIAKYILNTHPSIFETTLGNRDYGIINGLSGLELKDKQELIGGKTGYTFDAGGCLLTVLKNHRDEIFINIILGAKSPQTRIEEMQKIINWIN